MAQMLRHKETGELFIYTSALATLDILEPVVEDPIRKIVEEMAAKAPERAASDFDIAIEGLASKSIGYAVANVVKAGAKAKK